MKLSKVSIMSVAIVALLFILFTREGCNRKKIDTLEDHIGLEKAAQDTLKYELNKKSGEWEYSKQTYIASNGQLTDFLAEKDKELYDLKKSKKASVGIITKTVTRIDTIVKNLPPVDPTKPDTVRTARIENPHYTADIVSWPSKTSLGLSAYDSVKYSIGPDYRLVAKHSNPYVKVTELNSFYVKPDKKPKNWKYIVGGILAGAVIYGITR